MIHHLFGAQSKYDEKIIFLEFISEHVFMYSL